jgi:dsRNA-specific ribonuclease
MYPGSPTYGKSSSPRSPTKDEETKTFSPRSPTTPPPGERRFSPKSPNFPPPKESGEDIDALLAKLDIVEDKKVESTTKKRYIEKFFSDFVFGDSYKNIYKLVASEESFPLTFLYSEVQFLAQRFLSLLQESILNNKANKNNVSIYLENQGPVNPFLFYLSKYFDKVGVKDTENYITLLKKNDSKNNISIVDEYNSFSCLFLPYEPKRLLKETAPVIAFTVNKQQKDKDFEDFKTSLISQGRSLFFQPLSRKGGIRKEVVFIYNSVSINPIIPMVKNINLLANDKKLNIFLSLLALQLPSRAYVGEKYLIKWRKAFTARSASASYNYEKVEYMGDSVLKFVFSRYLLTKFPNATAQELSDLSQLYTNNTTLSFLSRCLGFHNYIVAIPFPIFPPPALCADVFESFVGTLFQIATDLKDNAFTVTYKFVSSVYDKYIVIDERLAKGNYKTVVHQIFERLNVKERIFDRDYNITGLITVDVSRNSLENLNKCIEYLNTKGKKYPLINPPNPKHGMRGSGHSLDRSQAEQLAYKDIFLQLIRFGLTSENVDMFYRQRKLDKVISAYPFKDLIEEELKPYTYVTYDITNDINKGKILYRLLGTKEGREEMLTSCVWEHNSKGDKDVDPLLSLLYALLQ